MSNCSCISVYIDNPIELLRDKITTARKIHKCGECGRDIVPGEKYEYHCGKHEGEFEYYKTCIDCLSVRNTFFCEGWFYGMVWEHIREHIHEMNGKIDSDCLVHLTSKARKDVCEMIEQEWKDS